MIQINKGMADNRVYNNMQWKRIIDEEPKEGTRFFGALMTTDGDYEPRLCYRDEDGYYHDVLAEYRFRMFASGQDPVMVALGVPTPPWAKDARVEDLRLAYPPDWWIPIASTDDLESYSGSPSEKNFAKEVAAWKDFMTLRNIENEMNDLED
jgi:hypothetical protein